MSNQVDPKFLKEILKAFINVLFTDEDKQRLEYFNSRHPISEPIKTGVDSVNLVEKKDKELFDRLISELGNLIFVPQLAQERICKESTITQIALYDYCRLSLNLLDDCNIMLDNVPDNLGTLFVWILRETNTGVIRYYE